MPAHLAALNPCVPAQGFTTDDVVLSQLCADRLPLISIFRRTGRFARIVFSPPARLVGFDS
jgi:hypothetical protein